MKKAVFIDRDGVINSDEGLYYVYKIADFRLNPGVGETLQYFKKKGYLIILITNQGGVAKSLYTHQDVQLLHDHMQKLLAAWGAQADDIFYCPHHPDFTRCLCRKPSPLMIQRAMAKWQIDPEQSMFIGDRGSDMQTAEAAGVRGVKVETNGNLFNQLAGIGLIK